MMSNQFNDPPLDPPPPGRLTGSTAALIWTVVVLIAVVAAVAVFRVDNWAVEGNQLSSRFQLDTSSVTDVDPSLVAYVESSQFSVAMQSLRAIAVDGESQVFIVGDSAVQVYDANGSLVHAVETDDEPRCVVVAGDDHPHPGRIYVGTDTTVERFDSSGRSLGGWRAGLNERSRLTSIVVFEDHVFAADAGNRVVLHWDAEGQFIAEIGNPDPARNIRGFVVPSAHFDIAIAADGILRAVNPGARRIEAYTLDGDMLGHWGHASAKIDGFFGCCNPASMAILPDGQFVTAEKGIPRVKIYSADGEFQSVVATSEMLNLNHAIGREIRADHSLSVLDVAVDAQGRVLVLDPNARTVRIFERKESI